MKKKRNILVSFIVLIVMLGFGLKVSANDLVDYGGVFYEDVPEAKGNRLGAAPYFHIFANRAHLKGHTNGNVGTKELSGSANFGTKGMSVTEYHYMQQVREINGASGIKDRTKMVFGESTIIDVSTPTRPAINGRSMDRVSSADIFMDKAGKQTYIDFEKEFNMLEEQSRQLGNETFDRVYDNNQFKDNNLRYIDVSDINKKDVHIKLQSDILVQQGTLYIKGLEKNNGTGDFKNVYVTIDTGNNNSYSVNTHIQLMYGNSSEARGNRETTDFSDSTILFNFMNNGEPFSGDIHLGKPWCGSILAPKASLSGGANIDGSIMVNDFRGAGETHRWDWQENEPKGSVELVKVDGDNAEKVLSGAEFSLYKQGTDKAIKTGLHTDEAGKLEVKDLELGSYYFVETKAPEGYELTTKEYHFDIKKDSLSQVEVIKVTNKAEATEEPKGSVELIKVDGDNEEKVLSGAEFSLCKKGTDKAIKTGLHTDEAGKLEVKGLELGSYYFVETKAPEGYELTTKEYHFDIKKDSLSQVEVIKVTNKAEETEEPKGSVELIKVDGDNPSNLLNGAIFSLYKEDGTLVKNKIEIKNKGKLILSDLTYGKYYFKEDKAPEGYELSQEKHMFTISKETVQQIKQIKILNVKTPYVEPNLGGVKLTKVDEGDGLKKLQGAVFDLYSDKDELISEGIATDSVGELTYEGLFPGKYYFKEVKAPEGYELDMANKTPFTITGDETSRLVSITVTNKQQLRLGHVVLEKSDVDNPSQYLEGAVFSLFNDQDVLIADNLITNVAGKIEYKNLELGSYYFVETRAPEGYIIDQRQLSFDITDQEIEVPLIVTANNKQKVPEEKVGGIRLNKSGDDGYVLPGAMFNLYTKDHVEVLSNLVTNELGIIEVDNLAFGDYYFKEIKAPHGYLLDEDDVAFSITEAHQNQLIEIAVVNNKMPEEPWYGSVKLKKVASHDDAVVLKDAVFNLYTAEGQLIGQNLTTDEQGMLHYNNLLAGRYYFKEIKAPEGYMLLEEVISFELIENNVDTTLNMIVPNEQEPEEEKKKEPEAGIEVTKVDTDHPEIKLPNATYGLYLEGTEELLGSYTTGADGTFKVEHLAFGRYYLKEEKAPNGYDIDPNKIPFELTKEDESQIISIQVSDKQLLGEVALIKVDEQNLEKRLAGAVFNLYQGTSTKAHLLEEGLTTNESGNIFVKDLEYGEYYFEEVTAPIGYILKDKIYPFVIDDETVTKQQVITVTNKQLPDVPVAEELGKVVLKKVSSTDKTLYLKNAEFSLYQDNGKRVFKGLLTDETGQIKLSDLAYGEYYFKETKAPDGYKLDSKPIPFKIDKAQEISVELVVENDPIATPTIPKEPSKPVTPSRPNVPGKILPRTNEQKETVIYILGSAMLGLSMCLMIVKFKK